MSNSTKAVHIKADGTVVPSTFFDDNGPALALVGQQFLGGDVVPMNTNVGVNGGLAFFIVPFDCTVLEIRVCFGGTLSNNGGIMVYRDTRTSEATNAALQSILPNRGFPTLQRVYRFAPQPTAASLLAGDRINVSWGSLGYIGTLGLSIHLVVQRVADTETLIGYP